MQQTITTDVAIIGGGILGLWLANRLKQQNVNFVLLETNRLGNGQSRYAQGILHGGLKYALHGIMSKAATSLQQMPALWQACLKGEGPIDLSDVKVLATHQYLWSSDTIKSKLAKFFASKLLHGKIEKTNLAHYPEVFQNPHFKGTLYKLNEIVIDMHSLLNVLIKPIYEHLIKIENLTVDWNLKTEIQSLHVETNQDHFNLQAKHFIFTAGEQNDKLLSNTFNPPKQQLRPLHMGIIKHKTQSLPLLYGHCLEFDSPKITITSHFHTKENRWIWYCGGQYAEEGIQLSPIEQALKLKDVLIEIFPWYNFDNIEIATFHINRAEGLTIDGKKPDECVIQNHKNNWIAAWPTKMVLTPMTADRILEQIKIQSDQDHKSNYFPFPKPEIQLPFWEHQDWITV